MQLYFWSAAYDKWRNIQNTERTVSYFDNDIHESDIFDEIDADNDHKDDETDDDNNDDEKYIFNFLVCHNTRNWN